MPVPSNQVSIEFIFWLKELLRRRISSDALAVLLPLEPTVSKFIVAWRACIQLKLILGA